VKPRCERRALGTRLLSIAVLGMAVTAWGCSEEDPCDDPYSCTREPRPEEEPVEPLEACFAAPLCAHAAAPAVPGTVVFVSSFGGNVLLGSALFSERGALVPWGSVSCCGGGQAATGIAVLEDGSSQALELSPLLGSPAGWPPAAFVRGTELGIVTTLTGWFDQVLLHHVDTFEPLEPLTVPLGGVQPPAVVGVGSALVALLVTPAPRLVALDATLGERLADVPLGEDDGERPTLTATCAGLLATWVGVDGALRVVAFDKLARRRSPIRTIEGSFPGARSAAWDGVSVVVTGAAEVLELGINGEIVSRTASVEPPLAAVGTTDGMLVLTAGPGDTSGARLLLLERDTGAELQSFGDIGTNMYGVTGSAAPMEDAVWFATSSYDDRDTVVSARVECTR
jgi:hypothetical protein